MKGVYVYALLYAMLVVGFYLCGFVRIGGGASGRLKRQSTYCLKKGALSVKEKALASKPAKQIKAGRVQQEICDGLSVLRNLISAGGGITGDMVLVKLAARGGALEPVYLRMLAMQRLGRTEEAADCMKDYSDMPLALEYASILARWDMTDHDALRETVITFQRSIRQSRETASKRRDEIVSDLIYVPAILNVMLIFINFIYVGYFLEQREMLMEIFG